MNFRRNIIIAGNVDVKYETKEACICDSWKCSCWMYSLFRSKQAFKQKYRISCSGFFLRYNMKIVAKFILGGIKQTWAICPRIWVQCVFWADWIVSISWKVNFNLFLSKHFCLNLNICFEYIVPYCSMLLRFTHVHLTWYVPLRKKIYEFANEFIQNSHKITKITTKQYEEKQKKQSDYMA